MTIPLHVQNYCTKNGYTVRDIIPQDASPRQYYRVEKGGHTAILMQDDPDQSREGYRLNDVLKVGEWLRSIDVNVPEFYDVDHDNLLLFQEDFGQVDFKTALQNGVSADHLYDTAHEVIRHINRFPPPDLPRYYDRHIHKAHCQIIDYYVPAVLHRKNADALRDEYWSLWEGIESTLAPTKDVFSHVDYHLENLMYLPNEKGLHQCGVIDFQTAMVGPEPYTLVNLINDARSDTPPDIYARIMAMYDAPYKNRFDVLTAQFHSRVLGLFVNLPIHTGKMKYLNHLPRLEAYMRKTLRNPVLKPIKDFYDEMGITFSHASDIDISIAKQYVDDRFTTTN